jgi:hypothetical protein
MVEAVDRWQVDVIPLPITVQTEPDARPGCFLATGAGFVLSYELLARPTGEVDELAALMAERLTPLLDDTGGGPPVVAVRHLSVAEALAPLLEPHGTRVEFAGRLEELEDAADSLVRHLTGKPTPPGYASSPDRWAGWGVEEARVGSLFSATSELWRSAPWRHVSSGRILLASVADGSDWGLSVMGSGGSEHGIAIYSEVEDLVRILEGKRPGDGMQHLAGRIYSVSFGGREGLPVGMRREVLRSGWEVAEPAAYPFLMALNTPGGGVARRDWDDLVGVARAVADVAGRLGPNLGREEAFEYRDPDSGVRLKGLGTGSG